MRRVQRAGKDTHRAALRGRATQAVVKVARLEPVSAPHVAQQVRRDAAVWSRAARAVGPLEPVACEGVERVVQRLDLQARGGPSRRRSRPGPCRSPTAALLGGALAGLTLGVFERYLRRKGRTE
jgi:hypothetical protein